MGYNGALSRYILAKQIKQNTTKILTRECPKEIKSLTQFSFRLIAGSQVLHNQHVGCFKDDENDRDLKFKVDRDVGTVQECVDQCRKNYFV